MKAREESSTNKKHILSDKKMLSHDNITKFLNKNISSISNIAKKNQILYTHKKAEKVEKNTKIIEKKSESGNKNLLLKLNKKNYMDIITGIRKNPKLD